MPPVDPNTLAVKAVWQRAQDPPSAAAGMHRFVWDLRPTPPEAAAAAADAAAVGAAADAAACRRLRRGAFSVKLTVNGKSFTQPLTVKPDPRDGSSAGCRPARYGESGAARRYVAPAVSVTELSWFWIALMATVPPVGRPADRVSVLAEERQPILGNIAGTR